VATHVDRDEVVGLLHEEFAAVAELGAGLTDEQWATPTCLPGWTVKDALVHMGGTEAMLLGESQPDVDVGHLTHVRNDIGKSGERWVESRRAQSGADDLAWFRDLTDRRLTALDAMTQADFDAPSWTPAGPDETYGRFMRIRHFDCFMHEHDMRDALGLADRADPRHVASAITEPATALGYIVGKRAGLPQGTTVSIRLTGAVDTTWYVAVEERARVVETLDGAPTVALELPAMRFLRLTGGRQDGSTVADDVVVRGDADLAGRLVANLAFTI
jgi:uncharacterized protein (TIGR03083 family)